MLFINQKINYAQKGAYSRVIPYKYVDTVAFAVDVKSVQKNEPVQETLSFKNSETAACKMGKELATPLFVCNMDGREKLKPLTIGKSKNSRYFKNVKTLPVDYEANKNS
ncbi:hypothetical protein RF11_05199 [Thelohanellus kitauei]|uniref:DDE-1 domain-containing protein n=1 Tax=Thelohanellus kitauei TaxID=669202 RepID=A0A0C2ME17_THEKT|nr:hypothetical protein RF11_05199 [Thelohanellus kitauei]